jgi:hypothetical protein
MCPSVCAIGYIVLSPQAADAAKKAGNKVQGEAKGAGGGDGPSLGDAANKAKQAVGNVTSVSARHGRNVCSALWFGSGCTRAKGHEPHSCGMVEADALTVQRCSIPKGC